MGLIDGIVNGLFGIIKLQKDDEGKGKRRQQWLNDNGYDIERQLEINKWCADNIDTAIEEAYGYPYRTLQWEKIWRQWLRGSLSIRKHICKYYCTKEGLNYFDFDSPPKEYKKIK